MTFTTKERRREYDRLYRARNKEKRAQSFQRWYQKNRLKLLAASKTPAARAIARKRAQKHRDRWPSSYRRYKLRLQEAEAGRPKPDHCEICGATNQAIMFDHCHRRGVFRGWICNNCNHALGCVKDDPNHLRLLIDYLTTTTA
jgi:hypothetical protein